MSATQTAPAGWSWARFQAVSAEAGGWLWGTVKGSFNEKATLSQIIVDAVVGMIPLVGDATAVRDIIAVSVGMIDEPKRRDDTWQWVGLVVLIFALIPVAGGVIKGVGKLVIKAGEAAHLRGAARIAHMQAAAKDIVAFLNRIGAGNAEKWLLKLKVMEYQAELMQKFDNLIEVFSGTLNQIQKKLGSVLSQSLMQRIEGLKSGLAQIHAKGQEMIPQALKELNEKLTEIQQFVRSGGETTSRTTSHAVATGEKTITRTEELRLFEGAGAKRSVRGGLEQNPGLKSQFEAEGLYKREEGYPDVMERIEKNEKNRQLDRYVYVTTYAGQIVNRELETGEQIFRVFGPVKAEGVYGYKQLKDATAAGNPEYKAAFWGLGEAPKSAKEWRNPSGVLDEWNHDNFIMIGTVEEPHKIKACTGTIAEQTGNRIPGQYLPGGGKQAMIETPKSVAQQLNALADQVMADGKPRSITLNGVRWELKPTGWTDATGIHGYESMPGPTAVQTERLGSQEHATKTANNDKREKR
jgi:hypothetical protein